MAPPIPTLKRTVVGPEQELLPSPEMDSASPELAVPEIDVPNEIVQ